MKLLPIALLAVILLAGGLILTQFRRRGPLPGRFREAFEAIARGDYGQQLEVRTGDEFADLAVSFNRMSETLEVSFTTLRELAELDRLILTGAEPDVVVRRALQLAQTATGVVACVYLRNDEPAAGQLMEVTGDELLRKSVSVADELSDAQMIADALSTHVGGSVAAQLPVIREGSVAGVLLGKGPAGLDSRQREVFEKLADRLSLATTNWYRARTLYRQASFDALTGLLNRQAFSDRLSQCIDGSRRRATQGALLFMDLDSFKRVNDIEGHAAGDRILKEIATRLHNHLRSTDIVARLGGDEFAIIVPEYELETELDALCKKIIDDVRQPVLINRAEYSLDISVGVALFPRDGIDAHAVLMKADAAMYKAKEQHGGAFAFFDEQLNLAATRRLVIETTLRRAIDDRAMAVHFQPKVQLKDLAVVGLEALMRWPASGYGDFSPDEFLPVAEETGLIQSFAEIVISQSVQCLQTCRREGFQIDRVSVNISRNQFAKPGFADRFLELVSRGNGRPGDFEIDITESLFIRDSASMVTELRSLRSAGVTIALDDFGAGVASLNVLRSLPLDVVKLDRSFVTPLAADPATRNIARRVVQIAQALYLEVVAEGVETPEELQILQSMGCELAQGFLIGKPLPVTELVEFLRSRPASEVSNQGRGGGVAL